MMQQLRLAVLALFVLTLGLGGSAQAALGLYRVEGGALSMSLGVGTTPAVIPLHQGTLVEANVVSGQVISFNVPNIIVATQGAQFQIRDAVGLPSTSGYQAPEFATITLHNAAGGFGQRAMTKTKIMGYIQLGYVNIQSPNGYPTNQNWDTNTNAPGRYAYRMGNEGGFLSNDGAFGGPMGLLGQISIGSTSVDLDVFGKDMTEVGGGHIAQALSWATGVAQARNRRGDHGMNFGPDWAYLNYLGNGTIEYTVSGFTPGAPYDWSTGSGTAGKLRTTGAAAAYANSGSTGATSVRYVDEAGNVTSTMSFWKKRGIVTITLVQPALYNPGVSMSIASSLQLELQTVVMPEPGTALLFGLGLIGLAAGRRKA